MELMLDTDDFTRRRSMENLIFKMLRTINFFKNPNSVSCSHRSQSPALPRSKTTQEYQRELGLSKHDDICDARKACFCKALRASLTMAGDGGVRCPRRSAAAFGRSLWPWRSAAPLSGGGPGRSGPGSGPPGACGPGPAPARRGWPGTALP